jgi:hypothetical protein
MKANWYRYFMDIHCRNTAALIERVDQVLCELMDKPTKGASAATLIGN